MADYQIVAVRHDPPGHPRDHTRIVQVKTREGLVMPVRPDVVNYIERGTHRFWVNDPDTNELVLVETYQLHPGVRHIRTKPNSTKKDNLDSLPAF